jgi:hypothetical protein
VSDIFERFGGMPDPADGRRQVIACDREFPGPVVDLVILLEAFIVLGHMLRVVGAVSVEAEAPSVSDRQVRAIGET